ncbi:MAG: methyl-accepting chemotaxis protein [Defluviitaleaceae bacterium]|nr:methyl-accepting chemotaxis protein [Defluviitaleaceae bacterium]
MLSNFKIRTKLFLGFGVFFMLALGVVFYAIRNMRLITADFMELLAHPVEQLIYYGHSAAAASINQQSAMLDDMASTTYWTAIGIGVVVTLIIILIAFITNRSITNPMKKAVTAMNEMARGNMNVNLVESDFTNSELGQMLRSVSNMAKTIGELIQDLVLIDEKFNSDGDVEYRIDARKYENSFKKVAASMNNFADNTSDDIDKIINVITGIADGAHDIVIPEFPGDKKVMNSTLKDLDITLETMYAAIMLLTESAKDGKLDVRVDIDHKVLRGAYGVMVQTLNELVGAVDAPMQVLKVSLNQMKAGRFNLQELDARLDTLGLESDTAKYKGVFKEGMDAIEETMNEVSAYVEELAKVLHQVSTGDLTHAIDMNLLGDFDPVKKSVNSIISRLNETVEEISQVASGVSSGSSQLSQSSMDLAEGTNQQMMAVQEMSEGVSIIDLQAKDNANNAKKAAELAVTSKSNAETSNVEMKNLLDAMGRISKSSDEISHIIKTIESIAFQTNLLALNAAVEAARAGEMGRGFSVVAEEVRSLAARSAEAASETNDLIAESINNVKDGTQAASDTASSLDKIVQNISDVSNVVLEIFESSNKQTTAIGSINGDLMQVGDVAQASAATSEETAAAAEELDAQVAILKEKLSFFSTKAEALAVRKVWDVTTSDKLNVSSLLNAPGEHLTFDSGETIITEGEFADTMYFVLEGNVKVIKSHGTLNAKELAILKAGDLFGEMALFLKEPRTATVIANSNVKVVQIHRDTVAKFMSNSPETAYVLIETLCARLKNVLADMNSY